MTAALKQRPELRALAGRKEANNIKKQMSAEHEASRLSAIPINELSERAGLEPLPPATFGGALPPILIGGYGTALSNVFSGQFQTLQAGLGLDLNRRNRTAEANFQQSVIAERRLKVEQALIEQLIEAQVPNAMRALETARQRMAAATASARAAKDKLDSEVRLFQSGGSTNFLVLTRQNEYADSRRTPGGEQGRGPAAPGAGRNAGGAWAEGEVGVRNRPHRNLI